MKTKHTFIDLKTAFQNLDRIYVFALGLLLLTGCNNSVSDDFDDVNGNVKEKRLKQVSVVSTQNSEDNKSIYLTYDGEQRLSSITDGSDTSVLVYKDGKLSDITGQNSSVFNIEELYESPYNAFKEGDVLEYDENGNPYKIMFYYERYNYDTWESEVFEYTAEVTYDDVHNPYFYTLESAGIIEILDKVQLNFSAVPQSPEIVQAKLLFPKNNPSKILYRNEKGEPVYQMDAEYVYDEQDYPTSATVVATSLEDDETSVFTANFLYVD